MRLSPLHARLATAYKEKKETKWNQDQGPGIDGERVVKSGRAKIRQAQKETPRRRYDTILKDKAKLVIYATLNTTLTTKDHKAVATVTKKRKIEGDATPTASNICLKQAGDRWGEAQLSMEKYVMTNRPPFIAEDVANAKAVPTDKYMGKYKILMLNRVKMISLTVHEL